MTPEEKLMVILDAFEKDYTHLSNATSSYHCEGSEVALKRIWTKQWMEWLTKLVEDDPETIENNIHQYRYNDEVLEASRKSACGLQFSKFPNALQVYIRGFNDGQWWRKEKEKEKEQK